MHGQVATFYSYQGGAGRTMALANVAWILAANGQRVLAADWNLESPGLHRYFRPFLAPAPEPAGGVIDMIHEYAWRSTRAADRAPELARTGRYVCSVDWEFPGGGALDLLPAGRPDTVDWDDFTNRLGGAEFFDALRADMTSNYDFALIDSPSGVSDIVDVCIRRLPDLLVDCLTLSGRGIEGAAMVASSVELGGAREVRVLPVPMRVDAAEKDRAQAGRAHARGQFAGLPAGLSEGDRDRYWQEVEVPYRPSYAYEEMLATKGDRPGSPHSLLASYESLARYLTDGAVTALPRTDDARPVATEREVILHHCDDDQPWAEWIERVLVSAGIQVVNPLTTPSPPARDLVVLSRASVAADLVPAGRDGQLAIYVDDLPPQPGFPTATSLFAAGRSAQAVAGRLLALAGCPGAGPEIDVAGVRFPGRPPAIFQPPARSSRFAGRSRELRDLRRRLTAEDGGPVLLHGRGGVGKTQLALEYAHRFRNAYDIVWWIYAEPSTFADVALANLGPKLDLAPRPTVGGSVREVLAALRRGTPYARWLLIFDGAEEVPAIVPLLPEGPGHVLVTARNADWREYAGHVLTVDVFSRADSIEYLRRRVTTIDAAAAAAVAEALGDLPVAVAAAGAWLAETGIPASECLHELRHGAETPDV